ncbi:hypothetical protein BDR05DRAFT_952288 [Suillus weaverae]|nr:hypothetical protein BDR05DRAFT_952288 [Suillus weaverae]
MIISVAAMAGIAIASDNLVISPIGQPCDPPSRHLCGLRADLRLRAYSQYLQIQWRAQRASKTGTTTMISRICADLQAQLLNLMSPNDNTIASGSDDGTESLWDTEIGKVFYKWTGHITSTNAVARIWDIESSEDYTANIDPTPADMGSDVLT